MIQAGRSARHTFGSDPDAVGTEGDAHGKQDAVSEQPADLPPRPIWWIAARERASEMEGEQGRVVTRLLNHIEEAWGMVVELSILGLDSPPQAVGPCLGGEALAGLLAFLKIEVVGVFTSMASQTARMVPALGEERPDIPETDEIESLGERFNRSTLVSHLAAADPLIPSEIRDIVRRLSRELLDWYPDHPALAIALARLMTTRIRDDAIR